MLHALVLLVEACTEITIRSPDGHLVVANAEESGNVPVDYYASPSRRGAVHGGTSGCMSFTAKYGFIAGMNEVGLGVHEHALDLAVFQAADGPGPVLCKGDFRSWALGMHATVADLVAGLAAVRLVGSKGGQWGVHDASGASTVIEYVKGTLTAHNNSVGHDNSGIGVMTNDPTWDWHLQNVNNYAALQPGWYGDQNEPIRRVVPVEAAYPWASNAYDDEKPRVPAPIGHGYNLLGLPGDGSPPSRFIRAFFLRGYALQHSPPSTLNQTLLLGQELLNSVYKVLGTIPARNALDPLETTPVSTLHVTGAQHRHVYTRSRYDMSWRRLDLSRIDFRPTARKGTATIARAQFAFEDVTHEL